MTHQDFMAAIIARPDEDAPRLIYSDFLEEEGDGERAEFIRVQCELAAYQFEKCDSIYPGCAFSNGVVMWHDYKCPMHRKSAIEWVLLQSNLNEEAWLEDLPLIKKAEEQKQVYCWKRGFVAAVSCRLADWMQHGPAIVACQPIEEVRATDKWPVKDNEGWWWFNIPGGDTSAHVLPAELWCILCRGMGDSRGVSYLSYATEADAQTALSKALLQWAKQKSRSPSQ